MRRAVVANFYGISPTNTCLTTPTAAQPAAAASPQVTPGLVRTALRRIGLPAMQVHTQPADKTLVNFKTNFFTDPTPVRRTVTLLGQRVDVVATPASYTWHFGDGATATTAGPGARYPALDITHEYQVAHVTVSSSVDVAYTARFRVRGGVWQDIPGAVTITGAPAPLRVSEATAVLSGNHP